MTVGQFLSEYGLFVAQLLTIVVLVVLVVALAAVAAKRGPGDRNGLQIEKINKSLEETGKAMRRAILDKNEFRKEQKKQKKERKLDKRSSDEENGRTRVFLLDFKGDIRASATASLRKEISAILSVANESDHVVLRLENAGGLVHEHGLAASQLLRLRSRRIQLTVAIDKVAASGGYLMACVADRIIAAPFAIIGSIGVLAQLPNFHRFLEAKGVDFEQVTAGRFKRTLTMFGENTDEGRDKLRSELEDIHSLFKAEVNAHRPKVDLDRVATGEHWHGTRALDLGLIDEISTSDDFLMDLASKSDVYKVTYKRAKSFVERIAAGAEGLLLN